MSNPDLLCGICGKRHYTAAALDACEDSHQGKTSRMGRPRKETIGKVFGRLTVVSFSHSNKHGAPAYLCACSCGASHVATGGNLRGGRTISCGCVKREGHITHGHTRRGLSTPEYTSWRGMRERCTNPKHSHYKYYGARGITICARWNNFQAFLEDMGKRPKGTTLDRWPNAAGNYEPSNCRWATFTEQARNGRSRLTAPDVKNIKRRLALKEPGASIARSFSVNKNTIYRIADGSIWKDIEV